MTMLPSPIINQAFVLAERNENQLGVEVCLLCSRPSAIEAIAVAGRGADGAPVCPLCRMPFSLGHLRDCQIEFARFIVQRVHERDTVHDGEAVAP